LIRIVNPLIATAVHPIGIFDSGVGGLSVLRHIQDSLPSEKLLYFADQAHVPYGSRSLAEIRHFSEEITQFLLNQGSKVIVVACNTASAAALSTLRKTFPQILFVGMEPAVKPAALKTRSGKVGVLATENTFASPRYAHLMSRFAQDVEVLEDPCRGLVPLIEAGQITHKETKQLLRGVLTPMLAVGVDTLVLGCTHYPFIRPVIEEIIEADAGGLTVTIIDPAPAVARQTGKVLAQNQLLAPSGQSGSTRACTSASSHSLANLSEQLLGQRLNVKEVIWRESQLASA
jgi:glutamate racemase